MRVVAALELGGKEVVGALAQSLEADEEALQVQALRVLARLGPAEAIGLVAAKILQGGAVRQHAAQVLAMAGTAAVPPLTRLYARADYHGKRAIASTLAEIGGPPAFQFLLAALPPEDLDMIKHHTGCLRAVLGGMSPAGRLQATRQLRAFLGAKSTLRNPHAVIAGLILLGGIADPRAAAEAEALLLRYLDRRQPEPVRRNAAVSLARLAVPAARAEALVRRLMPFLCEPDWAPMPQNLLPLLQKLELSPAAAAKLVPLLGRSPHAPVQAHVLERLRGLDKPAVARAVLPFLASPHPRLREAAEAALRTMPSGIDDVFALMLTARDAETARRIDLVLRAYPEGMRRRYAARAAERVLALHEKGDGRAQALLEFVRGTDPGALQKRVAARLAALAGGSSPKRRVERLRLLRLLADHDLLGAEQRYAYALLLLQQSARDLGREARAADQSLRLLAGLARQDGAKLVRGLLAERSLGAEDYYYLGFHWVESGDDLALLGAALLAHVAKRHPRHRLGRAAARKMELQGRQPAARGEV